MREHPQRQEADILVVGGGIAGIALAGELAPHARVRVLERESQPAYHSSGRTAALYIEPYSNLEVFALTRGSLEFLLQPPEGFAPVPLAHPRGSLTLAPGGQEARLDQFLSQWQPLCPEIREISLAEASARLPALRPGYARRAAFDAAVWALDTDAMLQGWLRILRRAGGELVTDAEVSAIARKSGQWTVETAAGRFTAPVLVNAAGAWAGKLGLLAGAAALPLEPRRRSAALVAAPADYTVEDWPVVADAAHTFYFKPEGGALMLSPADATPTVPCDARPEEIDLALAVERAEQAVALGVRRFMATWAGLRTFVPDEAPVYGWDPALPGFYWAAGQGGSGFQTAPAAARWAAAEILGAPLPHDLAELGLTREAVGACRFG